MSKFVAKTKEKQIDQFVNLSLDIIDKSIRINAFVGAVLREEKTDLRDVSFLANQIKKQAKIIKAIPIENLPSNLAQIKETILALANASQQLITMTTEFVPKQREYLRLQRQFNVAKRQFEIREDKIEKLVINSNKVLAKTQQKFKEPIVVSISEMAKGSILNRKIRELMKVTSKVSAIKIPIIKLAKMKGVRSDKWLREQGYSERQIKAYKEEEKRRRQEQELLQQRRAMLRQLRS